MLWIQATPLVITWNLTLRITPVRWMVGEMQFYIASEKPLIRAFDDFGSPFRLPRRWVNADCRTCWKADLAADVETWTTRDASDISFRYDVILVKNHPSLHAHCALCERRASFHTKQDCPNANYVRLLLAIYIYIYRKFISGDQFVNQAIRHVNIANAFKPQPVWIVVPTAPSRSILCYDIG